MPITAKDIAAACGVSRGTVDRALNNRLGINPETKEKILNVATELGYKPDFLAKSLVTGKTMTIGVIVFDVYTRFFGRLVTSIETTAKEAGYFTYLTLTHKNCMEEKRCITHLLDRKVDGIILFPINKSPEFDKFLASIDVPVVTMINKVNRKLHHIGIDDRTAVSDTVNYLKDCGHKNILYVSTPTNATNSVNMYAVEERLRGFVEACKNSGAEMNEKSVIAETDYVKHVLKRMEESSPPSAIVCSNDIYALEIIRALKQSGFKIPEDVSIVGFDDIDELEYVEPGLTTVHTPIDAIGKQAVTAVIQAIEGTSPPREYILPYRFITRQSVNLLSRTDSK